MSANLNLVRSIYVAWERGDYSSAEWAHTEIEYEILRAGAFPNVSAKGRAEMRQAARGNIEIWGELHIEADEYHEVDHERVLVLDHYSGRGKVSGLEIGQLGAKGGHLFHLDQGKVTRLVVYGDRAQAFADLGLTPTPAPDPYSEGPPPATPRRDRGRRG